MPPTPSSSASTSVPTPSPRTMPSGTVSEIRLYRIIYDAIEEIEAGHEGHARAQVPRRSIWAGPRSARSTRSPAWAPWPAAMCWMARWSAPPISVWSGMASSSPMIRWPPCKPLQGRCQGSGPGLRMRHHAGEVQRPRRTAISLKPTRLEKSNNNFLVKKAAGSYPAAPCRLKRKTKGGAPCRIIKTPVMARISTGS